MINWISFQPLVGGMTLGAEKAFQSKPDKILSFSGIENDKHLLNYYKNVEYVLVDKQDFDLSNIDIVSAVPICAGLSMQNSSNRGSDAKQNENMYNITEISLSKIKPKVLIFENAPTLYTKLGEPVRENLYNLAKKYNYSISFVKTSTVFHGLPQDRSRTFCFFWKSEKAPILEYYNRENKGLKNLFDSIDKNSSLQENLLEEDFNNFYIKFLKSKFGNDYRNVFIKNNVRTTLQLIEKLNLYDEISVFANEKEKIFLNRCKEKISKGGNIWDSSPSFIGYDKINALVGKGMCTTIHPYEERFFNIREMLSLMGMPNDFELLGGKKNINHIAQNVPVNTSKDWHEQVLKFINGELKTSNSDYIMQNNYKKQIDFCNEKTYSIFEV